MYKLRTLLMYTIIAALFVVAISVVNPAKVNAADDGEPYEPCIIRTARK